MKGSRRGLGCDSGRAGSAFKSTGFDPQTNIDGREGDFYLHGNGTCFSILNNYFGPK